MAETKSNARSSRSHAIFRIFIQSKKTNEKNASNKVKIYTQKNTNINFFNTFDVLNNVNNSKKNKQM